MSANNSFESVAIGLSEFFDYKNQLMNDLISDDKIVRLMDENETGLLEPEDLIYKKIFPFEHVPDTTEQATTYICCEVDIKRAYNKTYLQPYLYIWVFTHLSLMRLPGGGIRLDELASEIVKVLNGSRMYTLGELNLKSVETFSPMAGYIGKAITFTGVDFNRFNPTGKPIPRNRKA